MGIHRARRAVFLERSIQVAGTFQGDAEGVVGVGILRVQAQGSAALLDGLVVLAVLEECEDELGMRRRIIRLEG